MMWHLRELVRYRELVFNLTVRELKARYKSSVLGFFWSLLNPLGMMLVFTVVFGVLMPNNQMEKFPIFLLCGLLPWNFFNAGVMTGTNSIVANSDLIKKVYFPREALPIASVLASLVNFLLALVVLFLALIVFRVPCQPVSVAAADHHPDPNLLCHRHDVDPQHHECVLPRYAHGHGSGHAGLVLSDTGVLSDSNRTR